MERSLFRPGRLRVRDRPPAVRRPGLRVDEAAERQQRQEHDVAGHVHRQLHPIGGRRRQEVVVLADRVEQLGRRRLRLRDCQIKVDGIK